MGAVLTTQVAVGVSDPLPWRGWTLLNAVGGPHAANWSATAASIRDHVLPAAAAHSVTHLQLSQQLAWNAEDLIGDSAQAQRDAIRQIARDCRKSRVHSSIWTHELSECPAANRRGGRCVLDDRLWRWLGDKYQALWAAVPEVDGVVLTISETAFDVTCEAEPCQVVSNLTVPERLVTLIQTVLRASPGKTVIMRAFVHTHANLDLMLTALHALQPPSAGEAELVVMAKAPPCDWSPYFPFNPLWSQHSGAAQPLLDKGIQLIMEMDLGLEMLGQNAFVAPMVEATGAMVNQARLIGAKGVSARIERSCLASEVSPVGSCRQTTWAAVQPNTQTLGSVNDVSLAALSAFLLHGNATVPAVWDAWGQRRGLVPSATACLARVLTPMYDAVSRAYFPLQQWATQHSNIALWQVILADLTSCEPTCLAWQLAVSIIYWYCEYR